MQKISITDLKNQRNALRQRQALDKALAKAGALKINLRHEMRFRDEETRTQYMEHCFQNTVSNSLTSGEISAILDSDA